MQLRRFYQEDYERRVNREMQSAEQRRHHYIPTQLSPVSLKRFERVHTNRGKDNRDKVQGIHNALLNLLQEPAKES